QVCHPDHAARGRCTRHARRASRTGIVTVVPSGVRRRGRNRMPKALILDNLGDEGIAIVKNAPGFEVDVKPPQTPEELANIIGDYDGLVVRSATKVTAEALAHAKKLKVIGRAGAGTDNIDRKEATMRGIVVMNTPGGNTISTCEHTLAMMLSLC